MADLFQVVSQRPGTEFLGGTETRPVMIVGIRTLPHGVYAEVRIPRTIYSADQVNASAIAPATIIETLFGLPGVVGVQWSQEANASGELDDFITITVQSSSGNSQGTIGSVMNRLGPQLHKPQILALRSQMDEAERL